MTTLNLFDEHHRELVQASSINEDIIAARGYQSVSRPTNTHQEPRDNLTRLGIPTWATREDRYFPGLLIPVYRPTGERITFMFKPRIPVPNREGKLMKYAAAKNRPPVIDIHPTNRDRIADPTQELWITEGIKKADSLTSRGICTAAISGVYNWRSKMGTLGDWEDIPLRGRRVIICFDADAHGNDNVLKAMIRLGNWLKAKGTSSVGYLITPDHDPTGTTDVKGVDDYFAAGGTLNTLTPAITSREPRIADTSDRFTDARLAETIADDVMDGGYCWAAGLGWLKWHRTRWRDCSDVTVGEAVRRYSLNRFGVACLDKDRDATTIDGWRTMLSVGRERAVMGLAKGIVERRADEFDQQKDLLNTPTGVVDLETGDIMPHDPDLLMRNQTGVGYHPDATHPDWDLVLTCVPDDVREYLQIRLGQALTGYPPPDDVLMILQGGGENGKSTWAETIAGAIGDYYVLVSDRALMANPDAHPTELMEFMGKRYAVLEETPEAKRLDTQRLKKVVGTPRITARKIRQDPITYEVTHSFFINTNHEPIVDEVDHGTWRRLQLVVFPYKYLKPWQEPKGPNDRRGDMGLRDRCKTDPAIKEAALAWLIAGARKWYSMGKVMPQPPQRVIDSTRAWRTKSDLVLAYTSARLVLDPDSHILSSELFEDFNAWLKAKDYAKWSDRTFNARFEGHDELGGKVARKKIRARDGLSRRPAVADPWDYKPSVPVTAKTYVAWIGVRFATDADLPTDLDDDLDKAVNSEIKDHVPTVPTRSDYPAQLHESRLTGTPGTVGTRSWNTSTTITDPDRESTEGTLFESGLNRCPDCRWPLTSRGHLARCTTLQGSNTQ